MPFHKATKEQAKLKAALFGPSGSGKTYSALRIAKGIGGTVAVIDTERGSASKYADRFEFDVCDLEDRSIAGYVAAIGEAEHDVLIIDSLSHGWLELLQEVDRIAKAKYRGNTWSAWSEGTPQQNELVDALLAYPGHVIATMRTKTAWDQEKDERTGKSRPVRVGLEPKQGKDIEYEFDLLMQMSPEHTATVLKDRTGQFQDVVLDHPDEDFGASLAAWLQEGEAPRALATREGKVALAEKVAGLIEKAGGDKKTAYNIVSAILTAELGKDRIDYADELKTIEAALGKYDIITGQRIPEADLAVPDAIPTDEAA